MKKIPIVLFIVLLFTLIPFSNIVKASDTEYEKSTNTTRTADLTTYSNNWAGQSFTIGSVGTNVAHNVTSVKLNIARYGILTTKSRVSIYSSDVNGYPTGSPLCYNQFTSSTISTSIGLVEFTFSPSYLLQSSTKYCIVLNTTGGDATHFLYISAKYPDVYTGGWAMTSTNSGVTWGPQGSKNFDCCFYEYGISNSPSTISLSSPVNSSTSISLQPTCSIYGNDSNGDSLTITWQSNYTGSYLTYQVNTSFTQGTICRWKFTGANNQFNKYYWRVYVNDGKGHNISKWFYFTTILSFMNVSYTINPTNNSFYNYNLNYNTFSTYLDELNPVLNLSFNKTCLQGFNTTTKLYLNKTYMLTYIFKNGTKTFNLFDYYIPSLKTNTSYSWSINTTYYNLSYNRTYYFKFNILIINLPSGSCSNTSLTVYNNTVNTTGKYETSYNSSTGNFIWLNFTGLAGNITGFTEDDLFTFGSSIFLITMVGIILIRRRKNES